MRDRFSPIRTIAGKDVRDALRDRFILLTTGFLVLASAVALTVAAVTLRADVATYLEARAALVALGRNVASLREPGFHPLALLRGFVEHVEIVGAVIGILIGYRAAAGERGRQTLALIVTRPVARWQFLAGKVTAAVVIVAVGLAAIFAAAGLATGVVSGVALGLDDAARLLVTFVAATLYATAFCLLGFIAALRARKPANGLMTAFTVWLCLVLIAPQIGDTLDPDNQVAGGVFKQLQIAKPQQVEILQSFSTYETLRNGIEAASPTKHFERLSFAVLGIKDSYAGQPLPAVLSEKTGDLLWLLAVVLILGLLLFTRPLDPDRLSKE